MSVVQPLPINNQINGQHPSGPPDRLELPELKVGDKVYAPSNGCFDPWVPATVVEMYNHCGKRLVKVDFLIENEPQPGYRTRARANIGTGRSLTLKYLAYFHDQNFNVDFLPVGVRVCAQAIMSSAKGNKFYSGIVADIPKHLNQERYLIFFDSGEARYIEQENVRLICKYEANVWSDMHPNVQSFIKKYIEDYPGNAMLTLRKSAITCVEFNGFWWPARVVEIDGCLAKLQFMQNNISFWVYRGSSRLLLNYMNTRDINNVSGEYYQEYDGKVVTHAVPLKYKQLAKNVGQHGCDKACSPAFPGNPLELKNVSPLAIPYYYGWKRDIEHNTPMRPVFYITPCGKKLETYEELHEFLVTTESSLEIDFFCFDFLVNCLDEFQLSRRHSKEPDISNGNEIPNVERVNAVDNTPAQLFTYIAQMNTAGVSVNDDDPGFLICCDCTDDCWDKKNCPCFNLIFESYPNLASRPNPEDNFERIGYENRRLKDKYVGGIYECNKKCKCKSSCMNRVVQKGLRYRLQIFKTAKKGYAIRAMQDIPEGSFICAYTGLLMNSELANEKGKSHGDEYLANLDLIESVFEQKAGYEEIVIDPPDFNDPDKGNKCTKLYGSETTNNKNVESSESSKNTVSQGIERLLLSPAKSIEGIKILNVARKSSVCKRKRDHETEEVDSSPAAVFRRKFGTKEDVYAVDAKLEGNLSRYMNHSCDPNTLTQNVFLDTHDPRFPVVAFFTKKYIKCGTELTWNYSYEAGSVDGKRIDCNCGAVNCVGRLL